MSVTEQIKSEVDLKEYLEKYEGHTFNGSKTLCPFHDDHTPSMDVNFKNGCWLFYCHSCKEGGDIFSYLKKRHDKSVTEIIQELQYKADIKIPEEAMKKFEYIYKDANGEEVFKKLKIKKSTGENDYVFFHKEGDSWIKGKGTHEAIPYKLDVFREFGYAIIAEGEKDADTLNAIDTEYLATSAPFGKGSWDDCLNKHFEDYHCVIFLYDVGAEKCVEKHAAKLKTANKDLIIKIASVPMENEQDDITDYLEKYNDPEIKRIKLLDVLSDVKEFVIKQGDAPDTGLRPVLTTLDSVEPTPVEWLWFNRIPLGKLSLLVGDPGLGKSFLSIYMAAQVTTGKEWPDIGAPNLKGSVIMITAEDGIADTVRIRADAAGADTEKIKILEGVTTEKGEFDFFNLIEYLPALEKAIQETKDVRLVILDPITSYLGTIDSHKNSVVRGALAPLSQLAEKYKIAVVAISHLNKNTALQAIYRTMGSLAFTAAARAVWAVSRDEADESRLRRFLLPLKTNLSIEPTCLAFTIKDTQVVFEHDPVDINPEDALSNDKSEDKSALNQASIWLEEALEDGPIASTDIYKMAKDNQISEATLKRAKDKLDVEVYKEGQAKDKKWFWRLSGG